MVIHKLISMVVLQNQGYLFGGPHSEDYTILGSILGSPYFWKISYRDYTSLYRNIYGCVMWGLGSFIKTC